ncbi:MAG: phosphoribosyltransferase [Maricaulis sp.]|nr:phosphoribosyltransferase [Maricaulis sp.]HAQ36431.1 ComF family protein [Alphaproteobacteria bacterium]
MRHAADLVWPPVSPVSGRRVDGLGRLDPAVWAKIHFLDAPWCALCGLPFPYAVGETMTCPACIARPPRFARARAAFVYDDTSRTLILDFKHGGRVECLDQFAAWMARAGADILADADAIIPVPLHRRRLAKRRFNQSALLSRAVSRRTGVAFEPHALYRARATPSQAGKSVRGRRRNVAGAFRVRRSAMNRIAGRSIILVDDVFTTGATADAAARALLRAGAAEVNVLALARVVRPVNPLT